jgi:hypothetical protein
MGQARSATGTAAEEQRSAQETVFDGAQLHTPVMLTALELGFAVDRGQRVPVLVPLIDPLGGDGAKLFRAVQFGNINEARSSQQLNGTVHRRHRPRS